MVQCIQILAIKTGALSNTSQACTGAAVFHGTHMPSMPGISMIVREKLHRSRHVLQHIALGRPVMVLLRLRNMLLVAMDFVD